MRLSDLTVEVRDKALTRVGLIRPEELDFELADQHNNVGSWRLSLPAEHPLVPVLRQAGSGIIVTGASDVLCSGPTVKPEFSNTSQDPAGTATFEGVTDTIALADALAWPEPTNPDPVTQTLSHDVRTGAAETLMHAFVNANIGPGAVASRRKASLTMGPDLQRGPVLRKSARFPVLGNLLTELATLAGLGFRVVQRGDGLVFETYSVDDLTGEIRLDVYNNTLAGQKVAMSAPGATRAIVAGQGDLTERQFVAVDTPESIAAEAEWGRRIERFVDQRQTDDWDELRQAGEELMAEEGFTSVAVQAIPMEDSSMQFGRDWYMGDRVSVVVEGQELDSIVTGYVLKANASGFRVGAVLGENEAFDRDAALDKRVQSTERRVSALERNGSGGGGTSEHTHDYAATTHGHDYAPTAHVHNLIKGADTRNVNDSPADVGSGSRDRTLSAPEFKAGSTIGLPGSYYGVVTVAPWGDDSGGGVHQTAYGNAGSGDVWHRYGSRSGGWQAWRRLMVADTGWQNLTTFANGWQPWEAVGGSNYPQCRRLSSGLVIFRGIIKSGSTEQAAVNTPAGYRPGRYQRFSTTPGPGGAAARMDVNSDGWMSLRFGNTAEVSLDSITYLAEN